MRKFIYPLLIVGFVLCSLAPMFYEVSRAGDLQPDRQFELVHNFYTDYNFYLSRIREGLEGRWTVVEKYTSEPHNGSLIHEMYLLMGRVGAMVRVPWGNSGDIYHAARVVLAITLLGLIAEFCSIVFTSGFKNFYFSVLAFLLAITASSWPILTSVEGVPRFGGFMPWWSVMDSLQRITFIPHLLAGQALLVFLIMSLTSLTVLKKSGNIFFLGILAFVLGMVFPPGLVFVFAVLGVWGVLRIGKIRQWFTPYVAIVLLSAAALVYLALMTSVYPWKRLAQLDILHPLPFDYWEYIKALGPMLPLGAGGLIVALLSADVAVYPVVSWVLAWGILLVLFHFVPQQSPLRFSEMIPHVPLGILTAYLFFRIGRLGRLGRLRTIIAILPIFLITLGILQMYSSWLWQKDFVDHKIVATTPLVPTGSYVMYPLKDFISGMGYIQDATKRDDIILAETTAGNYLPVYSGNTVYIGHDNTVNAEEKKALASRFFSGQMTSTEAQSWLTNAHIRMIYFGPQEREEAGGKALTQYYAFLIEAYSNPMVTVYTAP